MHPTCRLLTRRNFFTLGLGAAALPIMAAAAQRGGGSRAARSEKNTLAQRAARYRELILQKAMGPGGMIIAFLPTDTWRPFQEGDELHWYLVRNLHQAWGTDSPRPTVAEWYYGENTLWATGWLLWSQILRYRATREPEALETARKCFRDLNNIFRISRQIEPGLLGKPHGGRAGPTTSFDQSACPVLFYVMYAQELATPEEKAEAVENMALHGEYYLRRNWVMNHHGRLQKVVDPSHTSTMKYLACVYAAYQLTGETRFREAAFKYVRQIIQTGRLPWPSNPYETNHNLYYYAMLCDLWQTTEISEEYDWARCIREYWQAAQSSLDGDGLPRFGAYDTAKRVFTPYPSQWSPEERRWQSATCQGNRALNCALMAALALLARSHGAEEQAAAWARKTLLRLDESTLRWWWGHDDKFPEEMKPILNIYAPEVAGAWLAAYWMGRCQNAW